MPPKPEPEKPIEYPAKPKEEVREFKFIEKIFTSKKNKKIKQYEENYAQELNKWKKERLEVDSQNNESEIKYKRKLSQWEEESAEWKKRKCEFERKQEEGNAKIDKLKKSLL